MKILSVLVLIVLTEALVPSRSDATTPLLHVHPHGTTLSIMQFTTNESVTVDYDEIDKMFLHPEVIDRKIVVISIIGAFREGKNFFMDYCLRFMYAHYKSVNFPYNTLANKSDWIGSPEAPLIGFSSKAGPHRHTSGIVLWSDVFLHENLAIVLMNTQGLFDAKTSPANNFRIFALGTLVSSFQIVDLNDVIQENQLEYLQMATDYAKFLTNSSGGSMGKPFQSLLFLMRDWSSSPYGFVGGQPYLADVLQIKDDQSPELRDVRDSIMTSFEDVHCFLMPHPGSEVVSDRNYDGRFSRLEHTYQRNLKQLLEWMLDSKNLKIKIVLDSEVTGLDFNGYLKSYFETFQSPDTPNIPSIYEATVERQLANYVAKSISTYKLGINQLAPSLTSKNFTDELEDTHNKLKALVITQYKMARKMGSIEHDKQYEEILIDDIEAYYMQWHESMVDTHNKLVEVEAENQRKIKEMQEKVDTEFRRETERLVAEKIKFEKELAVLQLQQSLVLKEEEKIEAIRIIRNEKLDSLWNTNEALRQTNNEHEIEMQRIAVEIDERARNNQYVMKVLMIKLEEKNGAMQLQLQRDREKRLKLMKKDAEEKKEIRRMEQERLDREDAYRKEQLELLKNKTDTESIERRRQLELEEKRRVEEKEERDEEKKRADTLRRQDLADREQERQDMMMQFAQQIQSMAQSRMDQEAAARKAEEEKRKIQRIQAARVSYSVINCKDRDRDEIRCLEEQEKNSRRKEIIRREELLLLRQQIAREQEEREERWIRENILYEEERKEREIQRAMEVEQLEAERDKRQKQREENQRIFIRLSKQRKH